MDVKRWFYDNTDSLYSNKHVPYWLEGIISLTFALLFAGIAYKITEKHFHDPEYDSNLAELQQLLKLEKKIHKGKATDDHQK